MAVIDSVKLPDNSTYEVADNHSGYQKETLATPLAIDGTQETTVEGALGGLNDYGNALKGAISNENLFDNGWFTVNQRGFTSGTVSAYNLKACVDRWNITYGTSGTQTVTLGSSGLAFDVATSDYITLYQTYEKMLLKTYEKFTFSVMLANGTIHSRTITWADTTDTWAVSDDIDFSISKELSRYGIKIKADLTIKAVKLELGSVSTLANDVEPPYATELLKCQRYLAPVGYCTVIKNASGTYTGIVHLPVPMRGTPSIPLPALSNVLWAPGLGTFTPDTVSFAIQDMYVNSIVAVFFTGASLTEDSYIYDGKVLASAEL